MKLFSVVVLSIIVLCARAQDETLTAEKFIAMANDCKTESGATDDDVKALIEHQPSASTEAKCLRACIMKKVEFMDANGKIVEDTAHKLVKLMAKGDAEWEKLALEIVEACETAITSDDHCEAADEYKNCLEENVKEKGLKPFEL